MSFADDLVTKAVVGTGGVFGLRWLWQVWRASKKDLQSDQSESKAIANLKAEMGRLSKRVGELEAKLNERDLEVEKLQQDVDDQRTLRRLAEDKLDEERRRSAALEDEIADLERKK